MGGSPRIIAQPTARSPAACRRARVRQGQAFGGAEEAPSLTAAARDGDGNMPSDGRSSRRGSNKRMECKGRPKWRDARQRKPHTSRMPELGPYGSVRGARGNSRLNREPGTKAVVDGKLNSRTVLVAVRPSRYKFSVALACRHIIRDYCKLGAGWLLFDPDGDIVSGCRRYGHSRLASTGRIRSRSKEPHRPRQTGKGQPSRRNSA